MGSEMLAKNIREVLLQHEIMEFSVVQIFVICPASHCFTEAFCLVLLPAIIKVSHKIREICGMQGGQQLGMKAALHSGRPSPRAGPDHGRCIAKTLSLPLEFTLPTCTKRICNSKHVEGGSGYPEIILCCLSGSTNMNSDDVNSEVQI